MSLSGQMSGSRTNEYKSMGCNNYITYMCTIDALCGPVMYQLLRLQERVFTIWLWLR